METENNITPGHNHKEFKGSLSGRVFGGMVVVAVGLVLFAKASGAAIPDWITHWPMILIAIGLFVGARHAFRGPGWLILILVGTAFLVNELSPELDFRNYIWPSIIIVVGLMIMFRPKGRRKRGPAWNEPLILAESGSDDDLIDSVTIFGGVRKNIISKNFKGGELVTIFGGTELNFGQADMSHRIVLDITQIFGGAKLIVPPHWRIHSEEIVSIFGSVEDKRPIVANPTYDENKVLILKGTNIFGGIDIKSY
jgi:hypothetical protein